jgi:phospholipase/carboxylesterase
LYSFSGCLFCIIGATSIIVLDKVLAMPRTHRSVPQYRHSSPQHAFEPLFELDSGTICSGSLDFEHTLFAPLHYAPGYAYPLVVWLHGDGGDERQLQRIMPMISMQNYVAIAPRGFGLVDAQKAGRQRYGWRQEAETIPQAEQRVFESIELAERKVHVASQRVFLAGFDTGGTMALRLAMSHPRRFAGVLSLCGAFPVGGKPFGNLLAARQMGLFLATGRGSAGYPAQKVCEDLRLLHAAGLSIMLRQYPCGHELVPQMLADVNRWIMEQINPPPTSAVLSSAEWSHESE